MTTGQVYETAMIKSIPESWKRTLTGFAKWCLAAVLNTRQSCSANRNEFVKLRKDVFHLILGKKN